MIIRDYLSLIIW